MNGTNGEPSEAPSLKDNHGLWTGLNLLSIAGLVFFTYSLYLSLLQPELLHLPKSVQLTSTKTYTLSVLGYAGLYIFSNGKLRLLAQKQMVRDQIE
jgi:hypothetical protein